MIMKKLTFGALALAAIAAASCSGPKGWSVEGTIQEPSVEKIALEGYNNGLWYTVDSLAVGKNGKFSYRSEVPAHYAEIFRLTAPGANGGSIYFPVDSCDKVTVEAYGSHFGSGYVLGGSELARTIGRIDSLVAASNVDDPELRRSLVDYITSDTTGTIAYYIVGKSVGGKQIFDPADEFGNRVYGAAAQIFASFAPEDPRGKALRAQFFAGRQALGKMPEMPGTVLEADETGYIDITNYDDRGVKHSISDLVKDGKLIVLSFTAYGTEASVPYNAILNDIYTKNHDKGLEIFQIAFDDDEQAWKTVARNLPWITVWNSPSDGVAALTNYNVGAFPVTFIINRKGEIVARVSDPTKLAAEVAKYL